MRFPLKVNRSVLPRKLHSFVPSADDPRLLIQSSLRADHFSRAVSALKFGSTFKTTTRHRFPLTIAALASAYRDSQPVILDLGASDGITSLDVMESLPFQTYYVTDLNLHVHYQTSGSYTYFYDQHGQCVLAASDRWILYPDAKGAIFPLRTYCENFFGHAPPARHDLPRIALVNPEVQKKGGSDVIVKAYDVFKPWPHEPVDLVIAANLLNRSYFPDTKLRTAITNIAHALKDGGRLAIIDNRRLERSTIFRLDGGTIRTEERINRGTEIERLVEAASVAT